MSAQKSLKVEYYGLSDLGLVRSENQDSLGKFPADPDDLNNPKGLLLIIADGMGGHIGGKEASQTAVDIISKEYFSCDAKDISSCLLLAFETANLRINQSSKGDLQYQKKGTTCSALVLKNGFAHIAHVGDSRVYKISAGKIEQLTNDHTQVGEMLRKGILSKEEAENHPSKSVLIRALGIEPVVEVDIIENIPLHPEDIFVLCSDGLAKVAKDEIQKIVSSSSAADSCKELVRMANERGGYDNVTVQVIRLSEDTGKVFIPDKPEPKSSAKKLKYGAFALFFAFLAFTIFLISDNLKNLFSNDTPAVINNAGNNPVTEDDRLQPILIKADNYLSAGELDSALIIYNFVLADYPMHMAALNGTNFIAGEFIKRGDKLIEQKNYKDAVIFYRKAAGIRTEDQKLYSLILLCEKEIQKQNNEPSVQEEKLIIGTVKDEKSKNISGDQNNIEEKAELSNDLFGWDFNLLGKSDYNFSGSKITFLNTGRQKKVINEKSIEDFDIRVNLKLDKSGDNNRAGIIVGYNKTDSGNESYFLFSTDDSGNFILGKYTENQEKKLLSVKKPAESKSGTVSYNLKIKCLGPWIMIYNNNKLLDSFLNEDFISGRIGLFADVSSHAEFSDLIITTAFEERTQN